MDNYIIPVDSIFRNQTNFENANEFVYYMQDSLKNIGYVRLSSIELPKIYPSFSTILNNNILEIGRDSGGVLVTENIESNEKQYFNLSSLITDLNSNFANTLGLTNFLIEVVTIDGVDRVKISADQDFVLNFSCDNHPYIYQERLIIKTGVTPQEARENYRLGNNIYYDRETMVIYKMVVRSFVTINDKDTNFLNEDVENISILSSQTTDLGKGSRNYSIKIPPLGYYLGFRNKFYSGSNEYISETIPNIFINKYILVKINDYGKTPTNHGDYEYIGKVVIRDPSVNTFDNESNLLSKRFIFQSPEDISQLKVSLHDPFGNLIDLNDQDYSLTVELGVINNSYLKSKYDTGHP